MKILNSKFMDLLQPDTNIQNNPIPAEPRKSRKIWFVYLGIAIVVLLAASAYGAYYYWHKSQPKACTQEAKQCPDGSYVGRTGPNCEFTACPSASPSPSVVADATAGWQTYRNEEYGFEVKYPNDWSHGTDVMSEYFGKSFNENSVDFNCSFGVSVITNPDYLKSAYPNNKQVSVSIGSIPAIKIEGLSGGINYGDYLIKGNTQNNSFEITETIEKIIINKDGDKVAFGTVNNQGCINTFNQILSTFKFTQ